MVDAFGEQFITEFGGLRGGEQVDHVGIGGISKRIFQDLWDGGAATCSEFLHAGPVFNRQDAGQDRGGDARIGAGIAKAQKCVGLKEELRDGAGGACVDFRLEVVDTGLLVRGIRVAFRVGADGDVKTFAS